MVLNAVSYFSKVREGIRDFMVESGQFGRHIRLN